MDTLEKIKSLVEQLSVDATKFYNGNKSAGTRARKICQDIKESAQNLRKEILSHSKNSENE